ncbi:phage Gp37/Gp68 family protein [Roseomonas sp. JC162]|uniref:Phage Gp37/Gp68 family protein n=1 Tax=Neoroseomonas marina TaxID=1232220 RepID=A0A848EFT5_9PROT|nr:phage Gp37/Gp68 family protein [Neoroseomonas marina]NMJ43504.1 phage Gp37/Gp68 family protein [Neoroseomonas marina]
MAKFSRIEWTDHTFNPWWGCARVSPACDNCYAEAIARRFSAGIWGARAPRRFFGEAHWREPLRWNAEAVRLGARKRVFCASMADVFENRAEVVAHRSKLWELIRATPALDWLLLTKRPQLIARYLPQDWGGGYSNVWLGTTTENQTEAQRRVPHLLGTPSVVHFISAEPLLSALDVRDWLISAPGRGKIGWVIAGGESGARARPSDPAWFRGLRDDCKRAGVPFHFKQWGNWAPSKSGTLAKVSKAVAGRRLDGRIWNGLPSEAFAPTE